MGTSLYRVLKQKDDRYLVIDCIKQTMPVWKNCAEIEQMKECSETDLASMRKVSIKPFDALSRDDQNTAHKRFSLIAGILPYIADDKLRSNAINQANECFGVSRQTIRKHLITYLIFQDISSLAPSDRFKNRELSEMQKNFRWGLNKFYYTKNKNSLQTAYTLMLKERYCDSLGQLQEPYPSFSQFKYFYAQYNNPRKKIISRNGIKDYQKNYRPLLGDGVQEYAPNVGVGMVDSTICDIYLVNYAGELIGRPILVACVDAYSSLCCGYTLSWEGGVYSVKELMKNIIADKVEWCKNFGVTIDREQWDCSSLPGVLVTDRGSEFISSHTEQLTELGIRIESLPSYRCELKGPVEKFFDVVQELFKPYLKGKGVVEPDFLQRGSHDYRLDARLTLRDFETILIRCIVYYNSSRLMQNFPYSEEMLSYNVKPFACDIWNWGKQQIGCNLIDVNPNRLALIFLPRCNAKFDRTGLKVNGLRYENPDYTNEYLTGKSVTVAFNPDNVDCVWLIDSGEFVVFTIIEQRFKSKNLAEVTEMKNSQRELIQQHSKESIQSKIDLINHISAIADGKPLCDIDLKAVRKTRSKERAKTHKGY